MKITKVVENRSVDENIRKNLAAWNDSERWQEWKFGDSWSSYPSVPEVAGKRIGNTEEMWEQVIEPMVRAHLGASPEILEIAVGCGRISQFLIPLATRFHGVDITETCIAHCRERFAQMPHARFWVNNGTSLHPVADGTIDLVFSWDSFVHIAASVTRCYVEEIARVLKPGGVAILHHSNAGAANQDQQLGWRSDLTAEFMRDFVAAGGLELLEQQLHYPLPDGGYNDAITIFSRPA